MATVLEFSLASATTTGFTVEPNTLDTGANPTDTYEFELWANVTIIGTYTYVWNPTINILNTITYASLGYTGTGNFVPGALFNVGIRDITAGGVKTYPLNAPDPNAGGILIDGPVPCFPRGTPILTYEGYKPVETLTNNDTVITSDGRNVGIKVFNFKVAHADQQTAPYHIFADALGHYYPPQDVQLSGLHAIQDSRGVWQIPKYLAKHNSGVQQYGLRETIEYFHIECPNFFTDNLITNGAVVESFKNRQGSRGVVYVWNKELNGFTRNENEKIYPVPEKPHTVMIWS